MKFSSILCSSFFFYCIECVLPRGSLPAEDLLEAKQAGFSDRQLAKLIGGQETDMRNERIKHGVKPWVKQVFKLNHGIENFLLF